jgi:DNA polymerase V
MSACSNHPNSQIVFSNQIDTLRLAHHLTAIPLPIYSGKVSAGQSRFPSPAQDYEQEELDLNKHLIQNPPATFFFRVGNSYDSMIDVGILPNSLLIVDRSMNAKSSDIVLAEVEGELMVKRLYKWRGNVELRSENQAMAYHAITFGEGQELVVWGVVTFNVNALK